MTSNKPNDVLLPCPFCNGDAGVPNHADDCYFTLSAQLKESSASDLSLVPDVLRAWNRRAILAQPADQHPQGTRERFQKWVLSIEHPVKGWLDGHWLRRGDDREGYADEYVQGLWVAFKTFGAQPADQQGEPVAEVFRLSIGATGLILKGYEDLPEGTKLYRNAQPATAKVVLPDHQDSDLRSPVYGYARGWNACLDEVAKLNTPQ